MLLQKAARKKLGFYQIVMCDLEQWLCITKWIKSEQILLQMKIQFMWYQTSKTIYTGGLCNVNANNFEHMKLFL